MSTLLTRSLVGIGAFMLLDGLWLGVVMKAWYRGHMAPIARMADGGFAPNWPAALAVYLFLGVGLALFAAPRATGALSAAGYGALFGLVVYGVYDFTNYAMLRQWPLALTLVDVAWGMVASAAGTVAVWMVGR